MREGRAQRRTRDPAQAADSSTQVYCAVIGYQRSHYLYSGLVAQWFHYAPMKRRVRVRVPMEPLISPDVKLVQEHCSWELKIYGLVPRAVPWIMFNCMLVYVTHLCVSQIALGRSLPNTMQVGYPLGMILYKCVYLYTVLLLLVRGHMIISGKYKLCIRTSLTILHNVTV